LCHKAHLFTTLFSITLYQLRRMNHTLFDFPLEVISHILSFLDAASLVTVGATSTLMHELALRPSLWRSLYEQQWPEQFCGAQKSDALRLQSPLEPEEFYWKTYFLQKYLLDIKADTLSWTQISISQSSLGSTKPSPRYAHSGTVAGDKIVYIGGQRSQTHRYKDLFSYDTTTGQFMQPKVTGVLPVISKHTALAVGSMFYIFGGYDGVSKRHGLYTFDTATNEWSAPVTHGTCPISRSNHCGTVVGKRMYVFGGLLIRGSGLVDSNDIHYLDTETMTWYSPQVTGDLPDPRCGHKMVSIQGKIYLFGGGNGDDWTNKFNDLHMFDPDTNRWTKLTPTGVEVDTTTFASVWTVGRFMFVFGGGKLSNRGSVSNEVYVFDSVSLNWTKQKISGAAPSPRDDCTTNVVGDTIYLMHGYNSGSIDEFWSIKMSGTFYQAVHKRAPPARVIKESSSPMLPLSPLLAIGHKIMSPFMGRRRFTKSG